MTHILSKQIRIFFYVIGGMLALNVFSFYIVEAQTANPGWSMDTSFSWSSSDTAWNFTTGDSATIKAGDFIHINYNTRFVNNSGYYPCRGTYGVPGSCNPTSVVKWKVSSCMPNSTCRWNHIYEWYEGYTPSWFTVSMATNYSYPSAPFLFIQTTHLIPPGTYVIPFTVLENSSTWSPTMAPVTKNFYLTVEAPPEQAIASCDVSASSIEVGQSVVVNGNPSGEAPLTCDWSGGGVPATSNSCNPFSTTYSTPGTKTISFNLNTGNGTASCQSTITVTSSSDPAGAICSISTTTAHIGEAVTLTGTPSGNAPFSCAYNAPGGVPGSSSSCNPFTTSYGSIGTKTITFSVVDSDGDMASCSRDVIVESEDNGPVPSALCVPVNQTVGIGDTALFTGTSTGPSPVQCSWTATGGTPDNSGPLSVSNCATFSTSYDTVGIKNVLYTVDTPGNPQEYSWCTVVVSNSSTEYTLTVTRNGQGTASSNPGSIDCGSTCNETYPENELVALSAIPNSGWRFVEWQGSCSGTAPICNIIMDSSKNVTAVFRPDLTYEEF